jgi:outer membrane protein assembly factor BamB
MASYATGPRATPTVDPPRVFVVGASGMLRCHATASGEMLWQKDFVEELGTRIPAWGISSAPLVDGERLIAIVGGVPDGEVVAFDKQTGEELWRALPADAGPGYGQPVLIEAGGKRQLIVWHPAGLASLDPTSGAVYWQEPWEVPMGMTVSTPVRSGSYLLVSQFYGGSLMMRLGRDRPTASRLWQVGGTSEMPDETRALHALVNTPVIEGDQFYGVCSYGQLRGLDARNGERFWESRQLVEPGRWASAHFVRQRDRYFINTDQGDLVIARFSRWGYEEIDRTHLIEPTTNSAWGRGAGDPRPSDRIVNWSHPAYAHRRVYARNDREILCASLEGQPE